TFCLLGVASPSDLIQDTRTTPFNIGHRIELTDFTDAEAAPLAAGLGVQVFRCSGVQADNVKGEPALSDPEHLNTRTPEPLLRSEADAASLLDLYAGVRRGQRVLDDPANQLVSFLRLAGIVRVQGRRETTGEGREFRPGQSRWSNSRLSSLVSRLDFCLPEG